MPTIERIDNLTHKDLRVLPDIEAAFGEYLASAMIFPSEIAQVQREFPIFFRKKPDTGEFYSSALFGLEGNENLFLVNGQWHANYLPAVIARGPFLIGFDQSGANDSDEKIPVLCIDRDSPCVNHESGERLFLDNGDSSPYTQEITRHLLTIHDGIDADKKMINRLTTHNLIEPATVDIVFDNGKSVLLQGIYAVSERRMAQLDAGALAQLNAQGILNQAFLLAASLGNIQRLIDIKNTNNSID